MPKRKITRVDFVPQIQQLGKAGATKLRVAAYARVSSESEEQEHSLSAQTDYFEAFIKENPLWEYVGLYVDDGVYSPFLEWDNIASTLQNLLTKPQKRCIIRLSISRERSIVV